MNNWLIMVLFIETCVYIYALNIDEKCYSTQPCHRHRLKCNDGNSNRKIAITDAKFGFKTSPCAINGCELSCCKEEVGDCFEPFSKNHKLQRLLYDRCEFQEECSLDDSYRINGCDGGLSTYTRIEYDCLEESSILRTTGSLSQKKVSVMFKGSDPGFPDTGITCSIRNNGIMKITNYYTRLTPNRSEDDRAVSKPDSTDCPPGYKMSLQINNESIFLCHEEAEFFYSEPTETGVKNITLNLVINRLDDTDVLWLGFSAPGANFFILSPAIDYVTVSCNNIVNIAVAPTTATMPTTATTDIHLTIGDPDKAVCVGIGVGVGFGIISICILVMGLMYIIKRRFKPKTEPSRIYSELAANNQEEANNYTSLDEGGQVPERAEPSYENI